MGDERTLEEGPSLGKLLGVHGDASKIREKWAADEAVYGPFVQLSAPGELEIFALAGFDFAIVDLEHGLINLETAESMMRASHARGAVPFARVLSKSSYITGQTFAVDGGLSALPFVVCRPQGYK